MTAARALVAYGYEDKGDGEFVRSKNGSLRDKWVATDGGFLRFTREDGEWVGIPHSIAPHFEGVSGLDFKTHPETFNTVYPEAEVLAIYQHALEN